MAASPLARSLAVLQPEVPDPRRTVPRVPQPRGLRVAADAGDAVAGAGATDDEAGAAGGEATAGPRQGVAARP